MAALVRRLTELALAMHLRQTSDELVDKHAHVGADLVELADRAKNYLVNTRGIEATRITTVDGGCRADLAVELWIVPTGANPPAATTDNAVSPCPECRRAPRGRRGRRD